MNEHTVKQIGRELDQLKSDVIRMGKYAGDQISLAIRAVAEQSADVARQVIEGDTQLDAMKKEIESEATRIIALFHPLAEDLRRTIAAIKTAPMWERIGDIAVNIARRCLVDEHQEDEVTTLWSRLGGFAKALVTRDIDSAQANLVENQTQSIQRIGVMVRGLIDDALASYQHEQAETAVAVWSGGAEVDRCYSVLFGELIEFQSHEPRLAKACVDFLFTAKNLERVGDYVEQIAEVFFYEMTGSEIEEAQRDAS